MIDWSQFSAELKRRREQKGLTQDLLASKVGVRLATIARLEIGDRRPSIPMLEKLARALDCGVLDLLFEKERVETREPTLKGAPTFFRACVRDASERAELGRDVNTGRPLRADYSHAGFHLAIHIAGYLEGEDDAQADFESACEATGDEARERALLGFLLADFPGCMALVPARRRRQFMEGFLRGLKREEII